MSFKSFRDMPSALRAQAAAGLNSVIKLEPDQAEVLADILEEYEFHLNKQLVEDVTSAIEI